MAPPPPPPPWKNQRIRGARVAWVPKKSKSCKCKNFDQTKLIGYAFVIRKKEENS